MAAVSYWQGTIFTSLKSYSSFLSSEFFFPFRQNIVTITKLSRLKPQQLHVLLLLNLQLKPVSHPSVTPEGHFCYLNDMALPKRLLSCHLLYIHFLWKWLFFCLQISSYRSFVWCQQIYQWLVPFWGYILFQFSNSTFMGSYL